MQRGMTSFQPLQPAAASGAKLAALFSSDDAAHVSLQFKAPRAPRPAAAMKAPATDPAGCCPAEATGANPGIAFASTCHLFRLYEDGYHAVIVVCCARDSRMIFHVVCGADDIPYGLWI